MQIPIISVRTNIKPWDSIPRINWLHPLADGLVFYHYDTGCGGYDLTRNRKWSFTTANPLSRKVSRWGAGYQFPSSVSDGIQYQVDASLQILPPMSWACGFNRTAVATEHDNLFFCSAANSIASQPFCNWGFADCHLGTTNDLVTAVNSAGINTASAPTNAAPTGTMHCLAASAPSTTTVNWWLDGVPQTQMTGLTIQHVSAGDNIVIGTDFGGPGGFQGQVYWAAFWNRTLSQAEATQLQFDPYCFLIYPEDEMFATLVGVAAATTSEDRFHQPWSSVGRRYAIIAAG